MKTLSEEVARKIEEDAHKWAEMQSFFGGFHPAPHVKLTGKRTPPDPLTQMFDMQTELDDRITTERHIEKTLSDWVMGLTIAMESEIDEVRAEVNWKWWKNGKEIDMEALQGEVIDLWHFLLSLSRVVGLTPETILAQYMAKNEENHARQSGTSEKEGYSV